MCAISFFFIEVSLRPFQCSLLFLLRPFQGCGGGDICRQSKFQIQAFHILRSRPCSRWCLIHLYVVCHHFICNLGQNKMKQQTPITAPLPPHPQIKNEAAQREKTYYFFISDFGEEGSRFSIYFVQDSNHGQNKMEQQTPIPPNQG